MNRRKFVKTVPSVAILAASAPGFSLDIPGPPELQPIMLPKPEKDGGKSVLASLLGRKTTRTISSRELPVQVISNLLWAGFGVNRDKSLGPTQPDRAIGDPEVQKSYYYTDTGFIAQNIYLYAASVGLAAWFHNCDKVNTVKEFNLKPTQRVLFAQTVGYPEQDFS